jgi:molybdenum cofactor cytidylyltransferase
VAGPERLAVALLAAGGSARFGTADKRLADLGGRPLIDWAAQAGRSIPAARHFAIVSAGFALGDCPAGYAPVVNMAAGEGLASSLSLAARQARMMGATALLVLLADMPLVSARHLAALIAAGDGARPVFSRAGEGRGQPPALFPAALFAQLEALTGDRGARDLAGNALFIPAAAEELIDVDTPVDLMRCRHLLGM